MADSFDQLLTTGLRFHREGRLDEAHDIYRQVLRDRPDHARAHHLLGLALRHRGQEADANRHFVRAAALEPDESLYRATLADSHRTLGNVGATRTELEALATQPVDDPDLRIQIGTLWGLIGEPARALDYCRPVLEMFPDHHKANLLLGTLLYDRGEIEAALPPLEKARQGEPPLPDPTCALASALMALGRHDALLALAPPRDARQMFGEGTLKAAALWLGGRHAEAKSFATAARQHAVRLGEWPQRGAYLSMLDQLDGLCAFRDAHRPSYESAAHAALPVIGDEHALAAAGYVVTIDGRSTRLAGMPVYGCRARHLVEGPNRFQAAFLAALDRLADGDTFAALIGSLDCRVGGFLAELPQDAQGRWSDLSEVDDIATRYVAWLADGARRRGLRAIVMGPPASNLQVDVMKTLARDAYLAIIERFDRALRKAAQDRGLAHADLLKATRGDDGRTRPSLYIDANHLLPTAIAASLQTDGATQGGRAN